MKSLGRCPSYLVHTDFSYCFRMNVPADLRLAIGKQELRFSLKTGYRGKAKFKARILAGQVQRLFIWIRKGGARLKELSNEKIQELVQQYLKMSVEDLENRYYEQEEPPFVGHEGFYHYVRDLDNAKQDLLVERGEGKYGSVEKIVTKILNDSGFEGIEEGSVSYLKLCRGIQDAVLEEIEIEKKYMLGDPSYKQEPSSQPLASLPIPQEKTSEKLGIVAKVFWNERSKSRKWKPRTKTEYETCLNRLLEFLGPDTQIHTVDYERGRAFKKMLGEKEDKSGNTLSADRINLYLGFASNLFKYAKDNHYIDINPFDGLQIIEKNKRVDELRDVFDQADLKKLFCESEEYWKDTHEDQARFWLPILGLYTGCRLEELCQLYVADVVQMDGIWCLNIVEDKPDKSVKTGERRMVPLHPFVTTDLNFIGYVKSMPDQEGRVFPELIRVKHRYSHYISRWFRTFKEKCGIVSPPRKKVFHSFRHTLIDYLKQNDIPESHIAEFVGHKNASITIGRYGKKYTPRKLFEQVVMKLDYGINLGHLKQSRFVKAGL